MVASRASIFIENLSINYSLIMHVSSLTCDARDFSPMNLCHAFSLAAIYDLKGFSRMSASAISLFREFNESGGGGAEGGGDGNPRSRILDVSSTKTGSKAFNGKSMVILRERRIPPFHF